MNAMPPKAPNKYKKKDGDNVPTHVCSVLMKNEGGTPKGVIAFVRDMTEIKNLQAQLVQTGKLAALGQLSAGLAHELNQPITSIRGFSQMLRSEIKSRLPERRHHYGYSESCNWPSENTAEIAVAFPWPSQVDL